MTTIESFDHFIGRCLDIFVKKNSDYGTSWRVLRPSSLTDQILIKISRIRSIDEKGAQKVEEPLENEFFGLINYSVMALIQMSLSAAHNLSNDLEELRKLYGEQVNQAKSLLENKNHDYGEAWRMMRLSSIIDIILMKVYRIKQIEENKGETLISEGIDANYLDIINYSIFALIKLQKDQSK